MTDLSERQKKLQEEIERGDYEDLAFKARRNTTPLVPLDLNLDPEMEKVRKILNRRERKENAES